MKSFENRTREQEQEKVRKKFHNGIVRQSFEKLKRYFVCLITIKRVPTCTIELWNMVGAIIKIMWEEQPVDPPNEYITPVNVP